MPTWNPSQHGITFNLSAASARQSGTFFGAGGPWIEGPITVDSISPAFATYVSPTVPPTVRHINGAHLDFDGNTAQGFDGQLDFAGVGYDPARNFGRTVALSGPQTITPPPGGYCSLIAVISENPPAPGREAVRYAAVLTVVASDFIPPANALRPWWVGPIKQSSYFTFANINQALLDSHALGVSAQTITDITNGVVSFWGPDHRNGFAREIHPRLQMPPYYEDHNAAMSAGMCLSMSSQRTDGVLAGIVQWGLDSYGLVANGLKFRGNKGHSSGRHGPMLFAAKLLGQQQWLENLRDNHFSAEHAQTHYVRNQLFVKLLMGGGSAPTGNWRHGQLIYTLSGFIARFAGWAGGEDRLYFYDPVNLHQLVPGQVIRGFAALPGETAHTAVAGGPIGDAGYNYGVGNYHLVFDGVAAETVGNALPMPEWAHEWFESFNNGSEKPNCANGAQSAFWLSPPAPSPDYRRGNSADSWLGQAVVLKRLGLDQYWGGVTGDSYFKYAERYHLMERGGVTWLGQLIVPTPDTQPSPIEVALYDILGV